MALPKGAAFCARMFVRSVRPRAPRNRVIPARDCHSSESWNPVSFCHSRAGGNPEDGWTGGLSEPPQQKPLDTPCKKCILIEDIVVDNPWVELISTGTPWF